MTQSARVAIIGCGLIGTQWDHPGAADLPRTHAGAFSRNGRALLAALCDRDVAKARAAAAAWGCDLAFGDASELFSQVGIDIAVVASSTSARLAVIEPALRAGVRTFVIEKPLASSLSESARVARMLEAVGAKALVNFTRRWDPAMRILRDRIAHGDFGPIQRLVGYYGKGVSNNASHMIDLVALLCGAVPRRVRALGSPLDPLEASWSPDRADPALDAQLVLADAAGREIHLTMLGTDRRAYTVFELRILGGRGIVEVSEGGRRISESRVCDDADFPGYRVPGEALAVPARYREGMQAMAREAVQLALGEIDRSSCDVADALRTAAVVEAIRRSACEDGGWIEIADLRQPP